MLPLKIIFASLKSKTKKSPSCLLGFSCWFSVRKFFFFFFFQPRRNSRGQGKDLVSRIILCEIQKKNLESQPPSCPPQSLPTGGSVWAPPLPNPCPVCFIPWFPRTWHLEGCLTHSQCLRNICKVELN